MEGGGREIERKERRREREKGKGRREGGLGKGCLLLNGGLVTPLCHRRGWHYHCRI